MLLEGQTSLVMTVAAIYHVRLALVPDFQVMVSLRDPSDRSPDDKRESVCVSGRGRVRGENAEVWEGITSGPLR